MKRELVAAAKRDAALLDAAIIYARADGAMKRDNEEQCWRRIRDAMWKPTILALCLLACVFINGCGDDCESVRCGCQYGSHVIVTLPGAADGTLVTADTLACSVVRAETSRCSDTSARPPQTAVISASGFRSATVTLTSLA